MNDAAFWIEKDGTAHEACRLLFFVGQDFLGESPHDPGAAPRLGWRRHGRAYFCSECGDVWGRIVLVDSRGAQRPFDVAEIACVKHYQPGDIAGSMLSGWNNWDYINYMPAEALRRELVISINHWEREQHDNAGSRAAA